MFYVAGRLLDSFDPEPQALTQKQLEAKIREIESEINFKTLESKHILAMGAQAIYDRRAEISQLIESHPGREKEKALWEEDKLLCQDPLYLAALDCHSQKTQATLQLSIYQAELRQLHAQKPPVYPTYGRQPCDAYPAPAVGTVGWFQGIITSAFSNLWGTSTEKEDKTKTK